MKNFDLNFSEHRSFVFLDVCVTQRNSCESYSSNCSQNFTALRKIGKDSGGSVSYLSQKATALLSPSFSFFLLG